MNAVLEAIETRRSCRVYKPDAVPRELVEAVMRAGSYAASGMNRQPVLLLRVSSEEDRNQIRKMNAEIFGRPEFDPFYGAPEIIVVLADRSAPTCLYDGSLALGNMMLAASSLGLGSCWIHRAKQEFDSPEGKALLAKWKIEGDWEGIGHLALGYAAKDPGAPLPRKSGNVREV